MRLPTCLIRRGGVFYYRAKAPIELLDSLNRREVWISLRIYECLRQGLHAPVESALAKTGVNVLLHNSPDFPT